MKLGSFTAVFAFPFLTATAQADCYHKRGDAAETIRETDSGGLVWTLGKKVVVFETGGAGTGIEYRIASDAKGHTFKYEFADDNLVFGGVVYEPGCE